MRFALSRSMFQPLERRLLSSDDFKVTTFCYPTGVEALRIKTARAELIVLPYLGQQIWTASFDGREIGMKSMVQTPKRNVSLLENLGGFFFHCGFTAIAAPGEGDDHPLHGELPNAEFDEAWIDILESERKLSIGGSFEYAKAFAAHYLFSPSIVVSATEAKFDINAVVRNLKGSPMDLCYLGHINFRPVDGSRLEYSAPYTPEAVRVRSSVPSHLKPSPQYLQLLSDLEKYPVHHHLISKTIGYDPEIVFKVDYRTDGDGWAHGLQVHPDGSADWVAHRPAELPQAFRWISRTVDQDALAITEPATCGLSGYKREKEQGGIPVLGAQQVWSATMRVGCLNPAEAPSLLHDL
ncbi:DUF4432 family protein [Rhizobium leguminosarum]|uniref:DUF4432 family protein n=1 Tax=Rhizobium leguminosarum TaxID=384 RepID=UPI003D0296D5